MSVGTLPQIYLYADSQNRIPSFMKRMYILIAMCISVSSYAQQTGDSVGRQFHDDLLDHLVGQWHVTAVAHEHDFTSEVDVAWVLNHQFLLFHLKSNEVVPWWGVQMEYFQYTGYNHYKNRYTLHVVSIEGDEDLSEGFGYGSRSGNDFKTSFKFGRDTTIVQHLIWEPGTGNWRIQSRMKVKEKEGNVFLDMKLTKK